MENQTLKFMTIRETVRLGMLSEHQLRLREKQDRLPGIKVGNRFKVNVSALVEQLEKESRAHIQAENTVSTKPEAVS